MFAGYDDRIKSKKVRNTMGNRAVITTIAKDLGVYVHWNGGRDSIEAFLLYCKIKGYRAPENDSYGWARLCQVIGNFFGGIYSVGIDRYDRLDIDNGDNGTYIIKDWQIVGKEFEPLDTLDIGRVKDMLEGINNKMPVSEQLDINDLYKAADELLSLQPITTKQIKAIHTIVNLLDWTDDRYRKLLTALFEVNSCKNLTEQQASILIETLNKIKGE
jgi:hypothetical protein